MSIMKSKYLYFFMEGIFLFTFFTASLTRGILKGGRWDLYQHIAMADRFLNGQGFFYSPMQASSPYFPGIGFLSVLISYFDYSDRDIILLIIASLVGTVFLWAVMRLSNSIGADKWITLVLMSAFMTKYFDIWKSYMNEFKPDSLILLLGIIVVYFLDKYVEAYGDAGECRPLKWIILTVIFFLMGIFKQQGYLICLGLFLYVIFSKKNCIQTKAFIITAMAVGVIMVFAIVLNIADSSIQTIDNLSKMPYFTFKETISMYYDDIRTNNGFMFYVLSMIFIILYLKGMLKLNCLGIKWLYIAAVYWMFSQAGAIKVGGNAGNIQSGFTAFLPFVFLTVTYIINKLKENVFFQKKYVVWSIVVFLGFSLIMGIRANVRATNYNQCNQKLSNDKQIIEYLHDKYDGKRFLYVSDNYMNVARSGINPVIDLWSIPTYADIKYQEMVIKALENGQIDYIYVPVHLLKNSTEFHKKLYDIIMIYYVEDDNRGPEELRGCIYKAKQ